MSKSHETLLPPLLAPANKQVNWQIKKYAKHLTTMIYEGEPWHNVKIAAL